MEEAPPSPDLTRGGGCARGGAGWGFRRGAGAGGGGGGGPPPPGT